MTTSTWTVRHGDSARSQVWAITSADGSPMSLTGWQVHAQARPFPDSPQVLCEWTNAHGVVLGSAQVRLDNGALITTDTIQLVMTPADYQYKPREWSGVFDVEISLPSTTLGDPPLQRFTVVDDGHFTIVPDVTRDD